MNLAEARIRVGLSQRQVADKLKISDSAVCQWEKGQTKPKLQYVKVLASLYRVSIDELLEEIGGETDGNEKN